MTPINTAIRHAARAGVCAGVLAAACACAGCFTFQFSHNAKPAPREERPRGWFASFSPGQAKLLSPEEAKAVLIARAVVEKDATDPPGLDFRVTPEPQGWAVTIRYFSYSPGGGDHRLYTTGGFCVAHIDRDWKVMSITPGE